jgi:hypothetical protein
MKPGEVIDSKDPAMGPPWLAPGDPRPEFAVGGRQIQPVSFTRHCIGCHWMETPSTPSAPGIEIPHAEMPVVRAEGAFSHTAHANVSCLVCHDWAEVSSDTKDFLSPNLTWTTRKRVKTEVEIEHSESGARRRVTAIRPVAPPDGSSWTESLKASPAMVNSHSCTDCHHDLKTTATAPTGLKGSVGRGPTACTTCHLMAASQDTWNQKPQVTLSQ